MVTEVKVQKDYKKTELGMIPKDWDIKLFEEVMDGFSSGQTPYRAIADYYRGDIPWITSGELNYNIITDTIEKITNDGVRAANLKMIPKGTFLFAITGLEAAGTRGSCAITGIEATTNQSCMALYPKKNILITQYLYYYYLRYGNELAFKYCQGTKQQSYTGGVAKKLPIIMPPTIEEQSAIATILSDTDSLITTLETLIEKKRNIKQGAMQELLTGKKRLPGFSGKWEKKRLGDIGVFKKGKGIKKDAVQDSGLPCIRYGEIYTQYNEYIKKFYSYISSDTAKESQRINLGDLLFSGSGETAEEIGKCVAYLGDKEAYAGGDIVILSPFEDDSKYLSYLMNHETIVSQKTQMAQGDAVVHIYSSSLAKISFLLPPIPEQRAIAFVISDMDENIEQLEQELNKYKMIKQGMMQELLTGKIRLV